MEPMCTATDQTSDAGGADCWDKNTCPGTALTAPGAAHSRDQMRTEGGEHSKCHTCGRGADEKGIFTYLGFLSSTRRAEQPPPTLSLAPSQSE